MNATKEQLAATLNGREYGDETTKAEQQLAKDSGLVIVYGASGDLIELDGAVDDEVVLYDGGKFRLTADGPVSEWDDYDTKTKA